jgi:hypothetical protein
MIELVDVPQHDGVRSVLKRSNLRTESGEVVTFAG